MYHFQISAKMGTYQTAYDLVNALPSTFSKEYPRIDRMAPVSALNRIANVAGERIMLMMNNTELCRHGRMRTMNDVLTYLSGNHDDVGFIGDRGDFYRRKLAEQLFLTFAVQGVDHTNVQMIVHAAIKLQRDTSQILGDSLWCKERVPGVVIDDDILDILAKIADMY